MAHELEEQNDPESQSTSKSPTTSTADLSERDNKEIPIVKEEETNDAEVLGISVSLIHNGVIIIVTSSIMRLQPGRRPLRRFLLIRTADQKRQFFFKCPCWLL